MKNAVDTNRMARNPSKLILRRNASSAAATTITETNIEVAPLPGNIVSSLMVPVNTTIRKNNVRSKPATGLTFILLFSPQSPMHSNVREVGPVPEFWRL